MPAKRKVWTPEDKLQILKEAGLVRETVFSSPHDRLAYLRASRSVTSTAEKYGINFSTIYEWKNRYDSGGLARLQDKPPVRITRPPSISEGDKKAILQISKKNPYWGCKRIAKRLAKGGKPVSHTTVQKVLSQLERATLKDRGIVKVKPDNNPDIPTKAEETAASAMPISAHDKLMVQVLKLKTALKVGENLFQSVHPVKLPTPLGKCHLQEIVDVRGSFAFVEVHGKNLPINAVELLKRVRVWYKKELGLTLFSIKTPEGNPYAESLYDEYGNFLAENGIKHSVFQGGFSLDASVAEEFHRTVVSQFLNKLPTGKHKKPHDVQKVLDSWLDKYNHEPNDLNGGKSPWEMMTSTPLKG